MAENGRDGELKEYSEPRSGETSPGDECDHYEDNSPALKDQFRKKEKTNMRRSLRERFSSFRLSNRNSRAEKEVEGQSASDKTSLKTAECEPAGTEEIIRKRPLSVMQIHELIQHNKIQEAFSSIKLLEDELLAESNSKKYERDDTGYYRKAKDVNMLYDCLFGKMKSIIEDALGEATCDGQLIASVVEVIKEEEIAHNVPERGAATSESNGLLGMPKKWKALWRQSVIKSITKRIHSVPIQLKEENKSWLATHLHDLKANVSQDLSKIKHSVKNYYPEDYNVCDLYVENYHSAISSHLQENIINKSVDFEELYDLLDWVINTYFSEDFMGNPALKPEVNIESLPPLLEPHVLEKLKADYRKSLMEKVSKYWEKILEIEMESWNREEEPKREGVRNQGCYCLPMYIDIQQMIEHHVRRSEKICKDLERSALQICLEGLQQFIKRLENEFMDWDEKNSSPMSVPYMIVYINSLLELRTDTKKGDASDLEQRTVDILTMAIKNFREYFFNRLKQQTRPHFRQLLTIKWISSTEAFDTVKESIRMASQPVKYLKQPFNKQIVCLVGWLSGQILIVLKVAPVLIVGAAQEKLPISADATVVLIKFNLALLDLKQFEASVWHCVL
ncbi:exocyst complex component 3-like protein 4 [Microcaecilia unicolor]|uniref:Exocyst complex component 3-like protein 4 n=1 Tax=Microcaecilia unicolor TaxID=1415580 RepID=A0A6P7YX94_9AMPH|nr:exocyst complex component 3-like protein 4 [Microcaecilia unicolor]